MQPRRITYVLNIFPKLSETFIAGELAELRHRGVELSILSLRPPRDEIQHPIIRQAGLAQLACYDVDAFADRVKQFRPDLLQAHFATEATAKARELSQQFAVPFTFTSHGYDVHRKPPADFQARALAASAVVTVSEANAAYIHSAFAVPRERIHVIPCGVNTDQFCPPSPGNSSTRPPLVLCVARHVAVKNLGLLLEACARLQRQGLKFRCVMIGDGPLRAELEDYRRKLGLEAVVEMPGAADQAQVLRWWQQASVGVLTSDQEGMPVCLMEAAACGVPVVATRVGGIPELVQENVTGLLCPPRDASALAGALERLLTDQQMRQCMGSAARRHAEAAFSVVRQVDSLLALWSHLLDAAARSPVSAAGLEARPSHLIMGLNQKAGNVTVHDPFGAAADPDLPTLAQALDPELARREFRRRLPKLSGDGKLRLKAIRVIRHKPGRRCIVEYDLKTDIPGAAKQLLTLIGKVRARRSGNEGFRIQEAIWNAGFDDHSPDGISVPEPVGVISQFQMWFQRKVSGITAEQLMTSPQALPLARRVAEAIHKLHRARVPVAKRHTMADESRILRACLAQVAALRPELSPRLERLMTGCERLAGLLPLPVECGIHRDFYAAQVIADGPRIWLLDFDLYCMGDPALDVGNFIGHVTEQALRDLGAANARAKVEQALEDRFVELSGEAMRASVRVYALLSLARHIFLSTKFPERQHLTGKLLALCERRLARFAGAAGPG